ncbi:MAG: erythromycin esterase family protein [Cytophagales bacterium]|nr:erythromycin esterase family protein [Cytophagales bacterium]
MNLRSTAFCIGLTLGSVLYAQNQTSNLSAISIEKDNDFNGFDLFDLDNKQLFVLAEHWHNIKSVPRASMKVLKYLHKNGNVRILAIEQGRSAAHLINQYLESEDTILLRNITRNTMFWGKENYAFFQDLLEFNKTLPEKERIIVQSVDIEYKMESAIFVINDLIKGKQIPSSLDQTVGQFREIFEETRDHREQFDGLSVMFYYDKEMVTQLVRNTLYDLENQPSVYLDLFGSDFVQFATMILDMDDGLMFDYSNPNTNYKFRDRLIYGKFIQLLETYPNQSILCVIGMRHATEGSSIGKLNTMAYSPLQGKVMNIRISALFHKSFMTSDLRRINYTFPDQLKTNQATLIKHDLNDPKFKFKKSFDYTLFINESGNLTPFENVYKEEN